MIEYNLVFKRIDVQVQISGAEPIPYSDGSISGVRMRPDQAKLTRRDDRVFVALEGPVLSDSGQPIKPKLGGVDPYTGLLQYVLPRQNNEVPPWVHDMVKELLPQ